MVVWSTLNDDATDVYDEGTFDMVTDDGEGDEEVSS